MEKRNLDSILHCHMTGRTVSSVALRQSAVTLMTSTARDLFNTKNKNIPTPDGDPYYWSNNFIKFTEATTGEYAKYGECLWGIFQQFLKYGAIDHTPLFFLACAKRGGIATKPVTDWMKYSVEDVLVAAGIKSHFDKWFSKDAALFEKITGRVPSIGDVLDAISTQYCQWEENFLVVPFLESPDMYITEKIDEPFKRTPQNLGILTLTEASSEKYCVHITRLLSIWTWTLLIEAPTNIYMQEKGFDKLSNIKF